MVSFLYFILVRWNIAEHKNQIATRHVKNILTSTCRLMCGLISLAMYGNFGDGCTKISCRHTTRKSGTTPQQIKINDDYERCININCHGQSTKCSLVNYIFFNAPFHPTDWTNSLNKDYETSTRNGLCWMLVRRDGTGGYIFIYSVLFYWYHNHHPPDGRVKLSVSSSSSLSKFVWTMGQCSAADDSLRITGTSL